MKRLFTTLVWVSSVGIVVFFVGCKKEGTERAMEECSENKNKNVLKGKWEGTFTQHNLGSYPMVLKVTEVQGCEFSGQLEWPTLSNSITSVTGKYENDRLIWTENELLQGANIILKGTYKADYKDKGTLTGKWYYPPSGTEGGTFVISFK